MRAVTLVLVGIAAAGPNGGRVTLPAWLLPRLGPAAGALGGLLVFLGLTTASGVTEDANPTDSAATIAAAFDARRDDVRLSVSVALIGVFLFVWFLGWLRHRLPAPFGSVALGGGAVALAGLFPYVGVLIAQSNEDIAGAEDAARALLLLNWEYGGVTAPGWAALVGATSIGIIRGGLLPPWLVWGAWVGVLLALALAFSGFFGGFLVLLGLLWVVGAAIGLALVPDRSAASAV